MGKTLTIKGANFSINAIGSVSEEVPCTGLTLNQESLIITVGGEAQTLAATKTPANTTDAIRWSSSNSAVATVNAGIVTAVSPGNAIIMAACGNQSASCEITVGASASEPSNQQLSYLENVYTYCSVKPAGGNGLISLNTNNSGTLATIAGATAGSQNAKKAYNSNYYPIKLPAGATKIVLNDPSGNLYIRYIVFADSETAASPTYANNAMGVYMLNNSDNSNHLTSYEIPTVDGYTIDSYIITLRRKGGSQISMSDVEACEITYI